MNGRIIGCILIRASYRGVDSPLAMVVESVDALVTVATVATAFVHMKLAEETESLVRR